MTNVHESVADIRLKMANGDYLMAFDQVQRLRDQGIDTPQLRYLAVLSLARGGAYSNAVQLYQKLELDKMDLRGQDSELATDIQALWARLLKDRALSAREGRSELLRESAEAYEKVYRSFGGYYPAVNAASLWRLAGNQEKSTELAQAALHLLPAEGGRTNYWEAATAAECDLLLGDLQAAGKHLTEAARLAGRDYASLASTRTQLLRLCDALDINSDLLDVIRPPTVIHYAGHKLGPRFAPAAEQRVAAAIANALEQSKVGFGFGSLASGADILFAEALLRRGGELNLFLPFDLEEFKTISVAPAGDEWVRRFDLCLAAATSVQFATNDRFLGDTVLFAYTARLAMGTAIIRSNHLSSHVRQIVVFDGQGPTEEGEVAGTAVDVATWRQLGLETIKIDPVSGALSRCSDAIQVPSQPDHFGRRTLKAMIFGDFKGFSKLKERQLPLFLEQIMSSVASIIERYDDRVVHRNTWGDGLYLVVNDTPTAARLALDLQGVMKQIALADVGLPEDLGLRLGCHFGPVWRLPDPVTRQTGFMGEHVSRTARIEPITPEGAVYVTAEFAADLLVKPAAANFAVEYVGDIPAAKSYGYLHMYKLFENSNHEQID